MPLILVGLLILGLTLGIPAAPTSSNKASGAEPAGGHKPRSRQAPNIIVIQTDDQDAASLTRRVMPNIVKLLARRGTTFTDYIDSGPLCCPSRAVMLTGQYGHNNGVLWNNPNPYGDLRGKDNTLPVWLRRAGYHTAHLGKYLNLYARAVGDPNEVAPGWDDWYTVLEPLNSPLPASYFDYTLRANGHAVEYGSRPRDYVTRVLNDKAVRLIHRYVPRRKPLFMALDQIAPHTGPNTDPRCRGTALPDPRDKDLFLNRRLPMPPSFNEADVSDKPSFIRAQPRLTPQDIAELKRRNGCRLASLRAVDRGVRRVVAALHREHELGNTAILFTSDNGYLLGEHRAHAKVDPYEEALHVPLIVRLPRRMRGSNGTPRDLASTVANIDIAPTILRLAGAKPCNRAGDCRVLDGRSLLKAIRSDGRRWPHDRGILLELKGERGPAFMPCEYQGIRTPHQVFVRYLGAAHTHEGPGPCEPINEVEHYDLRSDPFELRNAFPATPGSRDARKQKSLSRRLSVLRDCAGIKGRDPEPSSGHYCE